MSSSDVLDMLACNPGVPIESPNIASAISLCDSQDTTADGRLL